MMSVGGGRCRGRKRSAAVGEPDSSGRGRSSTPNTQVRTQERHFRTAAPFYITDLCVFLLQIRSKNAEADEEEDQSEKKFRKCEKSGCPATYPVCFASASDR